MLKEIDNFGAYASAYTISNENQRWATTAVPNAHRVLTVAGSGDQALFYTLAGAKIVDTFDMTNNARVIQDIKFSAIKTISHREYNELIINLFYTRDITKIPIMAKLIPLLSTRTMQVIKTRGNSDICSAGLDANHYPENIPTPDEYTKLTRILKKPFSFVRCDLYNLGAKISGTYDLINISNIFDYCYDAQTQAKILRDLTPHLNPGGHIVYLPQAPQFKYDDVRVGAGTPYELQCLKTLRHADSRMILFQRTR